jgi:hypothetical protein
MSWIHEYYLNQWLTIISSLPSLHNIEETHAFKFFFLKCKYKIYMSKFWNFELKVHENKTSIRISIPSSWW